MPRSRRSGEVDRQEQTSWMWADGRGTVACNGLIVPQRSPIPSGNPSIQPGAPAKGPQARFFPKLMNLFDGNDFTGQILERPGLVGRRGQLPRHLG